MTITLSYKLLRAFRGTQDNFQSPHRRGNFSRIAGTFGWFRSVRQTQQQRSKLRAAVQWRDVCRLKHTTCQIHVRDQSDIEMVTWISARLSRFVADTRG